MAPKKVAANAEGGEVEGGPFRWTPENERKLLVLTQGRHLAADDYDRLVTVFPGTNLNGVKIRCSRLRVEQRKLYEELGWDLPDGPANAARKPPTKKRAVNDAGDGGAPNMPATKPRAKKAKKTEDKVKEEGSGGGSGDTIVVVPQTPTKKPCAKKGKKSDVKLQVDEEKSEAESGSASAAGVKEEQAEDEY